MNFLWNSCCTELTQQLRYIDAETGKNTIAAWKDLVSIYKKGLEYIVKETSLSFAALYSTKFNPLVPLKLF